MPRVVTGLRDEPCVVRPVQLWNDPPMRLMFHQFLEGEQEWR